MNKMNILHPYAKGKQNDHMQEAPSIAYLLTK